VVKKNVVWYELGKVCIEGGGGEGGGVSPGTKQHVNEFNHFTNLFVII
jgi:hypothetical protein